MLNDLIGRVIIGVEKEKHRIFIYLDNNAEIRLTADHNKDEYGIPIDCLDGLYYDGVNYFKIEEGKTE